MVVLGDGKLMPAAEQAIYGHKAGETFRFDFTYPAAFRVPELSGKTAQFEITLHSVAEKTTPELTEAFAQSAGYASLAAMREAVRAKKQKIHEDGADRAAGQKLLEMAGANLTVTVPEAVLDRTADNEMKLLSQRLSRSGSTARTAAPPPRLCGQATAPMLSGRSAPCTRPAPSQRPRTSPSGPKRSTPNTAASPCSRTPPKPTSAVCWPRRPWPLLWLPRRSSAFCWTMPS